MKKILIIGIKGMAGHIFFNYFNNKKEFDVYGVARNVESTDRIYDLDVSDVDALEKLIRENNFDIIINAIGILNKDAEDNPAKAVWFNSYFPHFLENVTKQSSSKVIHISTDCVFSGKDNGQYTEDSFKNGIGFYAQSKALGEIVNDKDLTLRTSIIGPELNKNGIGLLHWFLTQPNNSELNGFSQVFWSGVTTLELAKVIEDVIKYNVVGLKQISREKISKYDLLKLFNKVFKNNDLKINKSSDYKSDKSLKSNRTDYQYDVPTYEQMLVEVKAWMELNDFLYKYE
ncbi:SDR family oxidoreductase [Soonwooa sp.]|uniref:dTDP-4-dehydrorhamnose reductase family protein n=1 Tax=Soonwooa sp. TaxID=1938592 RepID=UPI002637E3FC|nr:SDR family oxidoreductase [Soonwooa sp.]